MDDMKSALERAMERADRLGKASEAEVLSWKYRPEGERLAAAHLKGDTDVVLEAGKYDDSARPHVVDGALNVLIKYLDLPRNETAKSNNRKAMEAVKELKRDKVAVENVYTKLRRVFNHYEREGEQQRRQAYEEVKRDVEARLRQALQQQGGPGAQMRINVESQPQFQQEWRRVLSQLESQYHTLLEEYKQELLNTP